MPDRLNPIGAEFGDMGEMGEVAPVKPDQEIQESDAFKKEMEKKARTVNEKEKGEKKEDQQIEHEIIVEKPMIQESKAQNELGSILDVQKPTSGKQTANPQNSESPTPLKKTVIATPSSDTSADLSKGDDNLSSKLPNPPTNKKEAPTTKVFEQKNVAPPPLTTPVKEADTQEKAPIPKKVDAPIQTHTSSDQGDSSPKQRSNIAPEDLKKEEVDTKAPPPLSKVETVEPPHKTLLLKPSEPKPLLNAPVEHAKIAPPPETPLLESSKPQEKPAIQAPSSTSELPSSLESKPETLGEQFIAGAQEKQGTIPNAVAQESAPASPLFETPFVAENRKEEIRISKEEDEKKSEGMTVQSPPESDSLEQEKHDNPDQGSNPNILDSFNSGSAPIQTEGLASPFQEAIGFDRLPPHILDLFDRIIGVITVLQVQGKTETTIHLNEKQSPRLQGTTVTITTFDTASLSYNIELKGPPEAVTLLQKNVEDLKKSFKDPKKKFNFEIHEIMISLNDSQEKQGNH